MVAYSLNGIADPEKGFSYEIVHTGARGGGRGPGQIIGGRGGGGSGGHDFEGGGVVEEEELETEGQ